MDKLTGLLDFGEKKMPFFKNGFVFDFVTTDIVPFQNFLPAETEDTESGFVLGTTHSGYVIAIYTGQEKFRTNAQLTLNTHLYVVSKNNVSDIWQGDSFDGVTFCGGCIDKIYHGRAFVREMQEMNDGKVVLVYNNDSVQFEFFEETETVHGKFFAQAKISEDFEKGLSVGQSVRCLSFDFEQSKSISELPTVLSNVNRIISFLVYRSDLFFDEIYLTQKRSNGQYENIATVYLKHESETDKKSFECINTDHINDHLPEMISLLWNNGLGTMSYIPEEDSDARIFKSIYVKEICSALEYEIDHSNVLSEENERLKNLTDEIKKVVKSHRLSENKLPEKTYDLINSSIGNWSNTLTDKIISLKQKHDGALRVLQNLYHFALTDEKIAAFVKYRNNTSHGALAKLSGDLAATGLLLTGLIYCNVFSRAGFNDEEIIDICKNIYFLN